MQNKIIGVVAPKGSGKTTRVAELVRQTPRVAVYDPMAATDNQYRLVAGEIVVQNLKAAGRIMAEDNFQLLYEPELPVQDDEDWFYPDFRPFIQMVWRRVQLIGPMMVVIDEAHYTMSKRTMPIEVLNIITNGRRYGLDIVWITQRFVGVNSWARANADEYWFFRLAHPADINTVSQIAGPEVADQVVELRRLDANASPVVPGQMLRWSTLDGSVVIEDLNEVKNEPRGAQSDHRETSKGEIPNKEAEGRQGKQPALFPGEPGSSV
jgi:Zonular occludens toxin (Zot)